MPRRGNVSGTPYEGIVAELKNISSEMVEINRKLQQFLEVRSSFNLQTSYLELITRKYNKKGFKKYFGKIKK